MFVPSPPRPLNDKNVLSVFLEGLVTRVCHPESKADSGRLQPNQVHPSGISSAGGIPEAFQFKPTILAIPKVAVVALVSLAVIIRRGLFGRAEHGLGLSSRTA